MTVIRGLSPLVRLRDFSFGRMKVRAVGGYAFSIKTLEALLLSNTPEFTHIWHRYGEGELTGGGFRLPLALELEFNETYGIGWIRDKGPKVVDEYGRITLINSVGSGLILPIFSKIHLVTSLYAPGQDRENQKVGGVLYDPLPDVLANLDHFGQRLEVWLETELSGGSREWRRLFRSAPAAQVSIGPLQDAGYVDEEGYIVRMPESGWLPVFGRNALGPYSQIDQFNPSRAS